MALTIARTALETCVKQGYHVSVHVLPLKPSTWLRKLVYFLCAGIISDTDRGMSEKRPCVYILASERNSTLYVGVTSDITRRAWEHRSNAAGGFARDYGVHRIMFVEFHEIMTDAILREKRIKKWRHAWNWS
jgi:putative endonuclease